MCGFGYKYIKTKQGNKNGDLTVVFTAKKILLGKPRAHSIRIRNHLGMWATVREGPVGVPGDPRGRRGPPRVRQEACGREKAGLGRMWASFMLQYFGQEVES